jgi:hypothetical protein
MHQYTNMAWPDDPYGTGQLWRKEPLLLVGLATRRTADGSGLAYGITYLRLSRTPPVDLSAGLSFGFRAAVVGAAERDQLAELFDLDVLRARRLAKVIVASDLTSELAALLSVSSEPRRGIEGLAEAWRIRANGSPGLAQMLDIARDLAGASDDLDMAAAQAGIHGQTTKPPDEPGDELLALCATERALISALAAAHSLGYYVWDGSLDVAAVVATNAWDCFTSLYVPVSERR